MKPTDDIRKHLSEKFESFEAEPQDASWDGIRFALDLKDKLETYEAEPQEESWVEIKFATDLSKKFDNFEAEPTADSWEKIRAALPASEPLLLSDKFKNYEAEPQSSTWENIQLATQLSSKFSGYEAEPTTDSWETIKAAITPEKERRVMAWPFAFRVGIAASIALLLGFGWLLYHNQEGGLAEINSKKTQSVSNQGINKNINEGLAINKSAKGGTEKEIGKNSVDVSKLPTIEQANDFGIASESKTKSNIKKVEDISIGNQVAKTIKKKQKNALKNSLENAASAERIAQNNNTIPPIVNIQKSESSVVSNANLSNHDKSIDLNLIDSKDFKQKNIRLPFGEIAYNNEVPMEEPEVRVRRKMILTSSIMPLQTYQALTILPQTSSYIQQVGSLNALDAQRLGVQARVGVMQPLSNRFSTGISLSYAGIRQAVSYEVNNGTYDVDLTSSTYTLVGVGETVSQNKFLHTVGLKLDNSYLVSNKKNKVFVLGGAEAVRVLNNSQYAYYLNASVALAYPVKSGKTVWIEPTYRYSLSQSLDANSYMQIRPSNIGLNVRVNFM